MARNEFFETIYYSNGARLLKKGCQIAPNENTNALKRGSSRLLNTVLLHTELLMIAEHES